MRARREIADMDRFQLRERRETRLPETDDLIVPGKTRTEFLEVGAHPTDIFDGVLPKGLGVGAGAKGAGCVEAEILAGLNATFQG